ncbi:MAG: UMP kinase [Simkaniaceae bacterium]
MKKLPYKRILLKLSGEALSGSDSCGLSHSSCHDLAEKIAEVDQLGIQIGIVVGGGNIFRGGQAKEFQFARSPADQIGMIATTINGIALSQALQNLGCRTKVMSALPMNGVIPPYNWSEALLLLGKGVILIFVGGTGNPYFTTDTTAAMRASEIEAEILFKATKVDGVYDRDPMVDKNAKKYDKLTYTKALSDHLKVMDATAIALCRENQIPIHVFNLFSKSSLKKALLEKQGGTIVSGD